MELLAVGVPVIITVIIAAIFFIVQENRNNNFQARTEGHFKELKNKLDAYLYQDGIPFLKKRDKQAIYDKALESLNDSDYLAAISILSDYLKRYSIFDTERSAVLNLIGISLYKVGSYEKALLFFSEMFSIADRIGDIAVRAGAWNNRSIALANHGKREEALRIIEMAIELKLDIPETWYNKGKILAELGRYEDALLALEKAIELKPIFPMAWNNKSATLLDLGRHEEALHISEKAIELDPNNPAAWCNKATALANLGRLDEALRASEKAIELDHKYFGGWFVAARTYTLLKNKDGALKHISIAIGLDPRKKEEAKTDKAFIWLWDDPDFKKIVE